MLGKMVLLGVALTMLGGCSLKLAAVEGSGAGAHGDTMASSGSGGAGGGGGAMGSGGACAMTPTFRDVLKKPLSSCSGFEPPCHNADAAYLHIDPKDANGTWGQLVNKKTWTAHAGVRVAPGDPGASFLYRKLIDDLGTLEGSPMPKPPSLGSGMWTELPEDEIEIVRCWIVAGAKND